MAKCLNFTYGQNLYKEQDKITDIFIIKDGNFRVMKSVPTMTHDSVEKKLKRQSFYQKVIIPKK